MCIVCTESLLKLSNMYIYRMMDTNIKRNKDNLATIRNIFYISEGLICEIEYSKEN